MPKSNWLVGLNYCNNPTFATVLTPPIRHGEPDHSLYRWEIEGKGDISASSPRQHRGQSDTTDISRSKCCRTCDVDMLQRQFLIKKGITTRPCTTDALQDSHNGTSRQTSSTGKVESTSSLKSSARKQLVVVIPLATDERNYGKPADSSVSTPLRQRREFIGRDYKLKHCISESNMPREYDDTVPSTFKQNRRPKTNSDQGHRTLNSRCAESKTRSQSASNIDDSVVLGLLGPGLTPPDFNRESVISSSSVTSTKQCWSTNQPNVRQCPSVYYASLDKTLDAILSCPRRSNRCSTAPITRLTRLNSRTKFAITPRIIDIGLDI